MLYDLVFAIHSCAMYAALLLFVANELLLIPARQGRRGPAKMAIIASRFTGVLLAAGVIAGIALAVMGGWSPLTSWLLASFALIAVLIGVENRYVRPWVTRAATALGGPVSPLEIGAIAGDGRALAGRLIMIALFGIIVALMTMKPQLNPFG